MGKSVVGKRIVVVVALAGVAVLGGCATKVSGTPIPLGEDERRALVLNAEDALGDYESIDACSLIEPATFDEFGDSEYGYHYSLDYCEVEVTESGGSVFTSVGQLYPLREVREYITGPPLRELDGDAWVGQGADDANRCVQYLVFADDVAMIVDAYIFDDHESDDLCTVAEAGMEAAIGVVTDGSVRHRDLEKDSFATLDACEVVPEDAVTDLPAFAEATEERALSGHFCRWTTGEGDAPEVSVDFGSEEPYDGDGTAQESEIGGRATLTTLESSWCEVLTEHIPVEIEGDSESGYVEVARVTVYGEAGGDMCQTATKVATAVWAELPES